MSGVEGLCTCVGSPCVAQQKQSTASQAHLRLETASVACVVLGDDLHVGCERLPCRRDVPSCGNAGHTTAMRKVSESGATCAPNDVTHVPGRLCGGTHAGRELCPARNRILNMNTFAGQQPSARGGLPPTKYLPATHLPMVLTAPPFTSHPLIRKSGL